MKALKLSFNEWHEILQQIAKHHPRSVWMIRPKMRKVLGFTVREHEEWEPFRDTPNRHLIRTIRLDFYDEAKRTMFLLKYGDWIKNENA
jgi:hypothetical protein